MSEIGPARLGEAAVIAELSRDLVEHGLNWRWRPQAMAKLIRDPSHEVIAARRFGAIIGFAALELGLDHAHLVLLGVIPSARRSGVGRSLMKYLEELARTAGVFNLTLEVRSANQAARVFYEKLGFNAVTMVPRYYDGRESALRMVRDLRITD